MKLAIVGSRNYTNYTQFSQQLDIALEKWGSIPVEEVISGGASGADSMAARWAWERGIPVRIFQSDWAKWGKAAGPMRNQLIIENATHVVAFPSKDSRGTQDSISRSKKLKRELYEFNID